MIIGDIAEGLVRSITEAPARLGEALFEPVVRLGVTGLARSGKTVFITSLVANLLDRGRMGGLSAVRGGRIEAAVLRPQPDDTVPRFDYEAHLAAMTGKGAHWPASTRAVSQLRISFRVRPAGMLSGLTGPRIVHLDIVDYPGEWLLDLGLLDLDYSAWSARVLGRAERAGRAAVTGNLRATLVGVDPAAAHDEGVARRLAAHFTDDLRAMRNAGLTADPPGRFLIPGDLEGSPVLTFAPLPRPAKTPRGSLGREMERRYDAYRARVVKPFFRDHFSRIDTQVVLADVLGAIHAGPLALADLRESLGDIMGAFTPGRNGWLSALTGRRVERILFAATKADHIHHSEHGRLAAIASAMLREARDRAEFRGARTAAMAIASLRATIEEDRHHDGTTLPCVRGRLADGSVSALYPGSLPEDPRALLGPAGKGAERWLDAEFDLMQFAPPEFAARPGDGPPHIRLDAAAEFLFGDRL